jgi:hypothetical protein
MDHQSKARFLIIGDPLRGGLPYIVEAEDSDKFQNQKAITDIWVTTVEVIRRGYCGVRAQSCKLQNGRYFQQFCTNLETPEGRVIRHLHKLAHQGICYPTHEVIFVLEEIYSRRGLPTPVAPQEGTV